MKLFEFNLNEAYLKKFFPESRVKTKAQIIEILMEAINYMTLNPTVPVNKIQGKIILIKDKMSRLFFIKDKKYFSIAFPFFVTNDENIYTFSFKNRIEIDSQLSSKVISIINCNDFKSDCSIDFISPICEEEQCDENFWFFLRELLLMEDGYVRYDYDKETHDKYNEIGEGHKHPLNHYDLFYSSDTTFKIGLENTLNEHEFIDLFNMYTDCLYLKKVR